MNERVALVTGAARGIGAATVQSLRDRGYKVIAVDSCAGDGSRRPIGVPYPLATREDLDRVEAAHPESILAQVADVRDRDGVARAVERGLHRFGRIDVVVTAASIITGGRPLWETDPAELQSLWDVDAMGVWNTAVACIPHMLNGPDPAGCRIVAVASVAGSSGLFRLGAYSMVKHAVVGLVRGFAADLVGTGVTAVAVCPGATRTEMLRATAKIYGLSSVEEFSSFQLIGRLIEPSEVAETIAFCCSKEGAILNGSIVTADGGFKS